MNRNNYNTSMLQTPVRSAKNLPPRANSGLKPSTSNQGGKTSTTKNTLNPYTVKGDLSMFMETTKENFKALSPSPSHKSIVLKSQTSLNKSTMESIKNGMTD